ncbi:hypothetical protein HOLleu_13786 [Holothuria leucospilota]|uniref:Uncharacterized protein n=1 Tax=Holothuria leucospilota TaxID=206669 RepID=A0A9Q1C6N5_HOLLE|nr:hypothetical protein HOLleu_13786 [Holothuria leucospilota]
MIRNMCSCSSEASVRVVNHAEASMEDKWKTAQTIYEFELDDIDGNSVSMEKYRNLGAMQILSHTLSANMAYSSICLPRLRPTETMPTLSTNF